MIVEIQDYFNKKRKIYDFLLSFLQSEDSYYDYFEKLLNILQEQEIQNDREEFEHFLRLILNISNYHHQTAGFYDKIEQILLYFKDKIKQTFSNLDIFNIFESNKKILLFLLKEDIIKADKSITNRLLETKIFFFFWPEIKDFLPVEEKRKIESYILNTDPEFFENYENKRKVGENDSYLCSLIRNDSIKEFVFYVNSNNVSFKSKIKRSYFETHAYLNEKQPTLIEYALFFGSIKIYNYLRHKIGTDLPEKTLLYSIHSNNKNLIHLIEDAENIDYKMFLNESIKCHHNDFAKYFENQLLEKGCDTDAVFRHYNYLYFPDCSSYDESSLFFYFYKNKNTKFVDLYLKAKNNDIEERIIHHHLNGILYSFYIQF